MIQRVPLLCGRFADCELHPRPQGELPEIVTQLKAQKIRYRTLPAIRVAGARYALRGRRFAMSWLVLACLAQTVLAGAATLNVPATYATISSAVAAAGDGDTIFISAGTYVDNVIVNKRLTIAGAGPATVVIPAISNPDCAGAGGGSLCAGGSNVFLVQANDVTIRDLTIDGNNPNLTSGVSSGGIDVDARNGIIEDFNYGVIDGTTVHDVQVRNVYFRGIYASSGGSGFNIHHNTLSNIGGSENSLAIFAFGGSGTIAFNTIANSTGGISTNHSSGVEIAGNVVTNCASAIHTDNAGDLGGSADVIHANTISDSPAGGWGISVFVPYVAPIVKNNRVLNVEKGMALFGRGTNPITTMFEGNYIDGGSRAGSIGVYMTTDQLGYGTSDTRLLLRANHILRNAEGVRIEQPGNLALATLVGNRIVGNGIGVNNQTPATLQAANNWWGCNNGAGASGPGCATVANGVLGTVTTLPHLVLGISAPKSSLPFNASTPIAASLRFNSEGFDVSAALQLPDDIPVTFTQTLGSFSSSVTAMSNGAATIDFKAGSVAGMAVIMATVDSQSVTANVKIVPACPGVDDAQATPPCAAPVTLVGSMNPANYRSQLLLTARVPGSQSAGSVTFSIDTANGYEVLCDSAPLINGEVECPVPGSVNVVNATIYSAAYSGDGNTPAASGSLTQFIKPDSVTLGVVAVPGQPAVGDAVVLSATIAGVDLSNKVAFNENGTALPGCGEVEIARLPGTADFGVASCRIPRVSPGLHNYVVTYHHATGPRFEQVVVSVTPSQNAAKDYADIWWAGQRENGWGLSVAQHGDRQFMLLYVYDDSGNPVWYVMPAGSWNSAYTEYTGALYQPAAEPINGDAAHDFNPIVQAGAPVGSATVSYAGPDVATLTYLINGIGSSKAVMRQVFAEDDGRAGMQVGDMWWPGAQEYGRGINIAQRGRALFLTWYTYDALGRNVFYAVPDGEWTGSTFTGDIYATVSSPWLGAHYDAAKFVSTKVGSMSLHFSDQENAVMRTTMDKLTRNRAISRLPF